MMKNQFAKLAKGARIVALTQVRPSSDAEQRRIVWGLFKMQCCIYMAWKCTTIAEYFDNARKQWEKRAGLINVRQ